MFEEYLIIATKQAVAVIAGGLITWLVSLLRQKKAELAAKDAVIEQLVENDQAMLRQEIVNTYYVWEKEGYMPPLVKESLYHSYERYKACNGNSFVEDIIIKVRNMPTKENL